MSKPAVLGGGHPNCTLCLKVVYPEEKISTGVKDKEGHSHAYHKVCFKCDHCHTQLTISSWAQEAGKVYCIQHYKEIFGRKGQYDNLSETGAPSTAVTAEMKKQAASPTTKAASQFGGGSKCGVCGKTAYEAESTKTGVDNNIYHNTCFKCSVCSKKLDLKSFKCNKVTLYCGEHFHQWANNNHIKEDETPAKEKSVSGW